jgi:MoaA/NifB/PqqE/SkfB family radical SAM enzyme
MIKNYRRLEFFPSYKCNNNCIFCYLGRHDYNDKEKTTEELKKDILESKRRGTKEISFLGGEPTIRPDIFELVSYARLLGFIHVKITTNGRMLSYPDFAEKLVLAGTTKIYFSIHGSNEKIHDVQTQVDGSFSQMMEGIRNVKKYPEIEIGANSTITHSNYNNLPVIAKLLVQLKFSCSEIIFFFPKGNALKYSSEVFLTYTEAKPFMEKALDIGIASDSNIQMRYVPYCILPDYISYICDNSDPAEREQIGNDLRTLDVIKVRKEEDRMHVKVCSECIYRLECEGPWRKYVSLFGEDEFTALRRVND